ncbi:hypothetical protein IPH25_01035 [bacterium]|nr:MAG: hypothetical protein IPG37_03160 [bacterium]QQR62011.1 MAG: hypothetical protein IPH25_01035 [bacterium]QQR62395.1 MAG: hypothetical protein IPH67_03110 [bacterium]
MKNMLKKIIVCCVLGAGLHLTAGPDRLKFVAGAAKQNRPVKMVSAVRGARKMQPHARTSSARSNFFNQMVQKHGQIARAAQKNSVNQLENKSTDTQQAPIVQQPPVMDQPQPVSVPDQKNHEPVVVEPTQQVQQAVEKPAEVVQQHQPVQPVIKQPVINPPQPAQVQPIKSAQKQAVKPRANAADKQRQVEPTINGMPLLPANSAVNKNEQPTQRAAVANQAQKNEKLFEQAQKIQNEKAPVELHAPVVQLVNDFRKMNAAGRNEIKQLLAHDQGLKALKEEMLAECKDEEQKAQLAAQIDQLPGILKQMDQQLFEMEATAQNGQVARQSGMLGICRKVLNYPLLQTVLSYAKPLFQPFLNVGNWALNKVFGENVVQDEFAEFDANLKTDPRNPEGIMGMVKVILRVLGIPFTAGDLINIKMSKYISNHFNANGSAREANAWKGIMATVLWEISFHGLCHGWEKSQIARKMAESAVCISYCKYYGVGDVKDAWFNRRILARPINWFYKKLPECVKNGWIDWTVSGFFNIFSPASATWMQGLFGVAGMCAAFMGQPKVA